MLSLYLCLLYCSCFLIVMFALLELLLKYLAAGVQTLELRSLERRAREVSHASSMLLGFEALASKPRPPKSWQSYLTSRGSYLAIIPGSSYLAIIPGGSSQQSYLAIIPDKPADHTWQAARLSPGSPRGKIGNSGDAGVLLILTVRNEKVSQHPNYYHFYRAA